MIIEMIKKVLLSFFNRDEKLNSLNDLYNPMDKQDVKKDSIYSSSSEKGPRKRQHRKCNLIKLNGPSLSNSFSSRFGGVVYGLKDEVWPISSEKNGMKVLEEKIKQMQDPNYNPNIQPVKNDLFFICQINVTELPYIPRNLKDVKLINIFASKDFLDFPLVRVYKDLNELVPLSDQSLTFEKSVKIEFETAKDYQDFDREENQLNLECSKIGGFGTSIQLCDDDFEGSFVMQISEIPELDLYFGDSGNLRIYKSKNDWEAIIEFH